MTDKEILEKAQAYVDEKAMNAYEAKSTAYFVDEEERAEREMLRVEWAAELLDYLREEVETDVYKLRQTIEKCCTYASMLSKDSQLRVILRDYMED